MTNMTHNALPLAKPPTLRPLLVASDRPLGKDRQPQSRLRPVSPPGGQVRESFGEVFLVFGPRAGEKDESVELPVDGKVAGARRNIQVMNRREDQLDSLGNVLQLSIERETLTCPIQQ
jgi:hypothetical protein